MNKRRNILDRIGLGFIGHAFRQPFIFATGLAALMHSTWSLGTLFAGQAPQAAWSLQFIGWIAPAVLIAFALDVGQIVTSAELRAGERTLAKYATFGVFAIATYYLQWLYIVHHMPALDLGLGVSADAHATVTLMRDAAIWIIPALLPLSTLLYTFSYASTHSPIAPPASVQQSEPVHPVMQPVQQVERYASANNNGQRTGAVVTALQDAEAVGPVHVECPHCTWEGDYGSKRSARFALTAHLSKHPDKQTTVHVNGHVQAVSAGA